MLMPSRYFAYLRVKNRKEVGRDVGEDRTDQRRERQRKDKTF